MHSSTIKIRNSESEIRTQHSTMGNMCSEDSQAQDDQHGIQSPEFRYPHSHMSEHGYAPQTSSVGEYSGRLGQYIPSEQNEHNQSHQTISRHPYQFHGPGLTTYNQSHLSAASTPAPNSVRVHQRSRSNSSQPWMMGNMHSDGSMALPHLGTGRCFSDGYASQPYHTASYPHGYSDVQPMWYDQSASAMGVAEYNHAHGHVHRVAPPLPMPLPQMPLPNDYVQSSVSPAPGPGLGSGPGQYGWSSCTGSYYPPYYSPLPPLPPPPPPPPPHLVPVAGPPGLHIEPYGVHGPPCDIPGYTRTPTPIPSVIIPSMCSLPPIHSPSPVSIRRDGPGPVSGFNGQEKGTDEKDLERDDKQKKPLHNQTRGKQFHDAVMKRIEQFEADKARRAEEQKKRAARAAREVEREAKKTKTENREKEAKKKADREARRARKTEKESKRAEQEARIADQEAKLTALREKEKTAKAEHEVKAKADREARKAEKDAQEKAATAQREAREKAKILAIQARSRALREEADQKQEEIKQKAAGSRVLRQADQSASQIEQFDAFVNNILEYSRRTDEKWAPDSVEAQPVDLANLLKNSEPENGLNRGPSTIIGMERQSHTHKAASKWTYADHPHKPKPLAQRLHETDLWFYGDNREEARFRHCQTIVTSLALWHEPVHHDRSSEKKKEQQMIMLVGDAIANLGAYVSERKEKRTNYFSEFADVHARFCDRREDGIVSYFEPLQDSSQSPALFGVGCGTAGIHGLLPGSNSIGSSRGTQHRRART